MRASCLHNLQGTALMLIGMACLAALGGCATTASIRHQSMLVQREGQPPKTELEPYPGIALFLSVACDDRIRFFMISPLVPLPPIIPTMGIGSGDQRMRVHLDMTREAGYALGETPAWGEAPGLPTLIRLITADGEEKSLAGVEAFAEGDKKMHSFWVEFAANCDDLDGATLLISPLSPAARHLGSVELRLTYKYSDEIQMAYMQ
jgi:hypothetical protein